MTRDYTDIIDLPGWNPSPRHPRMSRQKRAAQFAPFAALTGLMEMYDEMRLEVEREMEG